MLRPLLLVLALGPMAPHSALAVAPGEFAYHRALALETDAPVFGIGLNREIYRSVTRADLGDIRVFNGAGEVVPHIIEPSAEVDWTRVQATRTTAPQQFEFDAGAALPVDTVSIEFAERNTVATLELSSRATPDQPWELRFRGTAFTLALGPVSERTDPLNLDPRAHRYWRVNVDTAGGGAGRGWPALRLAWHTHRLKFVARGQGPFVLAMGNTRIGPPARSVTELFDVIWHSSSGIALGHAIFDGPVIKVNPKYLSPPPAQIDWRRVVLWGVLGASVLGMGWLALSLLQQLHTANGG